MDLPVTGGREEHQIRPPMLLVMASPVMPCESCLALDHLSADGATPVLVLQAVGATGRRRWPGQLSGTVLEVRLPGASNGLGGPLALRMTRRFDSPLHAAALCAGVWSGEPPRLPPVRGNVAGGDPASGVVRVATVGPQRTWR
jgi:hypothetical protein